MDRHFSKRRILIVEDNCDGAISLARLLRRLADFDVSFTTTPAQAIAESLVRTPDVVISDINLPGMDGCELAGELLLVIREVSGARPLLIALTGAGGNIRDRCLAAGFDHFFRKPVAAKALLSILQAELPYFEGHRSLW